MGILNIPLSGVCDASGAATITGWANALTPLQWSSFNISLQYSGLAAPTFTLSQGAGNVVLQGFGTGGQCQLGPLAGYPQTQPTQLNVSGATPGALITGVLTGMEATTPDDVSVGAVGFSNVGVAGDPAQLLPGTVGAALAEAEQQLIPAKGWWYPVSPFTGTPTSVAGYAGLLLNLSCSGGNNCWATVIWYASDGVTVLGQRSFGSISPRLTAWAPALGPFCVIQIFNADNASHLAHATIIPLAQNPVQLDAYLGVIENGINLTTPDPDSRVIMSITNQLVPANSTVTLSGAFVWPGQAIFTFSTQSNLVNAIIYNVDALGNQTRLAGGTPSGTTLVQLGSGVTQVDLINSDSTDHTPTVEMIATA